MKTVDLTITPEGAVGVMILLSGVVLFAWAGVVLWLIFNGGVP